MKRPREPAAWRWRRRVARGARGEARKQAVKALRDMVHEQLRRDVGAQESIALAHSRKG